MTSPAATSLNRAFQLGVALNLTYVVVEAGCGWHFGSLALLSDAGHNFLDVVSLLLAMLAFHLGEQEPTPRLTYGFSKLTILISLINAVALILVMAWLAYEGVIHILQPHPLPGGTMALVAGFGIVINTISALLFLRHQHDLNAKGAFFHLAADAGVSAGVVVAGLLIQWLGIDWLDGATSIAIAIIVIISTWSLFTESLNLVMDGVPKGVDLDALQQAMVNVPGVEAVHHLHTWALSTNRIALTAHLVVSVNTVQESLAVKHAVKAHLVTLGIDHATLEVEPLATNEDDEGQEFHFNLKGL